MILTCPTCGSTKSRLDAYSYGDRQLEGVVITITDTGNDTFTAEPDPSDKGYLSQFSKKFWHGGAVKAVQGGTYLECAECDEGWDSVDGLEGSPGQEIQLTNIFDVIPALLPPDEEDGE